MAPRHAGRDYSAGPPRPLALEEDSLRSTSRYLRRLEGQHDATLRDPDSDGASGQAQAEMTDDMHHYVADVLSTR